jgi:hypothetical protein
MGLSWQQGPEPGQTVVPHGIDCDLTLDEAAGGPSR